MKQFNEKTAKNHVSNILGKLHLADRTQAAIYAWHEGIVRRSSSLLYAERDDAILFAAKATARARWPVGR